MKAMSGENKNTRPVSRRPFRSIFFVIWLQRSTQFRKCNNGAMERSVQFSPKTTTHNQVVPKRQNPLRGEPPIFVARGVATTTCFVFCHPHPQKGVSCCKRTLHPFRFFKKLMVSMKTDWSHPTFFTVSTHPPTHRCCFSVFTRFLFSVQRQSTSSALRRCVE